MGVFQDDYDDDEEDDEAFVERELYDLSSGEEDEDDPKYNDFFGSDSQASDEEEEDESEEEVEDESDEGSEGDVEGEPLTPHQRKKQRIQDQIKALEEASVAPKPWDLKGEVKSSDRPENSLLGLPVSVERYVSLYLYYVCNHLCVCAGRPSQYRSLHKSTQKQERI